MNRRKIQTLFLRNKFEEKRGIVGISCKDAQKYKHNNTKYLGLQGKHFKNMYNTLASHIISLQVTRVSLSSFSNLRLRIVCLRIAVFKGKQRSSKGNFLARILERCSSRNSHVQESFEFYAFVYRAKLSSTMYLASSIQSHALPTNSHCH